MSEPVVTRRQFRPRVWAALLTLVFAALTIHLGNWQGDRAAYKLTQQKLLDEALTAPALPLGQLLSSASRTSAAGDTTTSASLRYRQVTLSGEFDATQLFFLDNKIQEGKAGYGVLQLLRVEGVAAATHVLVDRGWVVANNDRTQLPALETPASRVEIAGRINLPVSRNPGTADNGANAMRINYVDLIELTKRLNVRLAPFIIEQTQGPGHLRTERALPAANYQKNRAYQMQWYAFAALSVILFVALSFKKRPSTASESV